MRAGVALWVLALGGVWVRHPASTFGKGVAVVCLVAGLAALVVTLANAVLLWREPASRARRAATVAFSLAAGLLWFAWASLSAGDVLRSAF